MILVTGGYGCIGAELVMLLLRNTTEAVLLGSQTVNEARTRRVFYDVCCARRTCLAMDVGRRSVSTKSFPNSRLRESLWQLCKHPTATPNRDLGLQINLGGTQHLIESIKASGRKPLTTFQDRCAKGRLHANDGALP